MFLIKEPTHSKIVEFVSSQRELPFTYSAVGATNGTPPNGFTLDHNRIQLGVGLQIYERALDLLQNWQQFDLGWVSIAPEGVRVEVGAIVAVKARAFGWWSLNATRIVYVVSDDGPLKRFGFAYGTLPDHVECGEERFIIEFNEVDGSVWYDILAFSRPKHPLVRVSFPLARMLQKRFARDSMAHMRSLVRKESATE